MTASSNSDNQYSIVIALIVGCAALLVIAGWAFEVETLKRIYPTLVAMNPMTACCFVLAAVSLVLNTRAGKNFGSKGLALLIAAVGVLRLCGYVFWETEIDQLIFSSRLAQPAFGPPNRMAPNTAINFMLLGTALFLVTSRTVSLVIAANICSGAAALWALLAAIGYLYQATQLYTVGPFIPMAPHTAALFLLLSCGTLLQGRSAFLEIIRTRFIYKVYAGYALIVVVTTVITGVTVFREFEINFTATAQSKLYARSLLLGELGRAWFNSLPPDADSVLERLGRLTDSRLAIFHADGRLVAQSGPGGTLSELRNAAGNGSGTNRNQAFVSEDGTLYTVMPIVNDGKTVGYASTAFMATTLTGEVGRLRTAVLIGAALAALAALFIGYFFAKRVTTPLTAMIKDVEAISSGKYDLPKASYSDDEIGLLGRSFQSMAWRLSGHIEQLNIARDTAESANRAKRDFLASVNHEMRTPLNGVLGMLRLLNECTLESRARRFADLAVLSSEALAVIIDDVLDFSKIEAAKLEIEKARFSLPRVLHEASELFAERASAKGLAFEASSSGLPSEVIGDSVRVKQILFNLLANALRFTKDGGLSIGARVASCEGETLIIRFEVKDTGTGISEEGISRLFQPFSQSDSSISRTYGGTGLGLAISKQLVELMGGEIGVVQIPTGGSLFWFTIKVQRAPPAQESLDETAGHDVGGENVIPSEKLVLVADDNEINQIVVAEVLLSQGYNFDIVCNGKEAVEAVSRKQYDLILMDCHMPVMDGLVATRTIRAQTGQGASVPILALTANALKDARDLCLAAGMNAFCSKPVDPERLLLQIKQLLANTAIHPQTLVDGDPALFPALEDGAPPFEVEAVLKRSLNKPSLVLLILDRFEAAVSNDLARLEECLAAADSGKIMSQAHALRGVAGIIAAVKLSDLALRIETCGREGDFVQATSAFRELTLEVQRCIGHLPVARAKIIRTD